MTTHGGTRRREPAGMVQHEATKRRFEDELGSKRGVLRACLLILLDERAGHGYDLLTRLEALGYNRNNPGRIYRALRWLEAAGYVVPNWETNGVGPARRVYDVSVPGRQVLGVAAASLREQLDTFEPGLARYLQSRLKTISSQTLSFELLIETKLAVRAADEGSARRKLERLFGQSRSVDIDVRATGQVWIHEDDVTEESGVARAAGL